MVIIKGSDLHGLVFEDFSSSRCQSEATIKAVSRLTERQVNQNFDDPERPKGSEKKEAYEVLPGFFFVILRLQLVYL